MRKVAIIGVPMDLGANRRGVDMGPSAVRVTSLAERLRKVGRDVVDMGDVDVPIPEECAVGDPKRKYASEIKTVCAKLADVVEDALEQGLFPVVLGGDHSIAMGSFAGVSNFYRLVNSRVGLLWLDAHGDMNTPSSSPSGNVHGMPLSHLLGLGDPELVSISGQGPYASTRNTVLIGVRDLDDREKAIIIESGIKVFTMKDIDMRGMSKVMEDAIKVAGDGTVGFHLSFDIDVVDPQLAPGVGTPKKGGFNYREAHLCMELCYDSGLLTSLDMVEINPIFDVKNSTAELASELVLSALGKRIFL